MATKKLNNNIGAYVLLRVMPGKEHAVFERMKKLREVIFVNMLFGEWDLIVGIALDNVRELETFVCDRIRTIKEIGLTSTMIVAR